jgi:type IV secretion system protein VirD4
MWFAFSFVFGGFRAIVAVKRGYASVNEGIVRAITIGLSIVPAYLLSVFIYELLGLPGWAAIPVLVLVFGIVIVGIDKKIGPILRDLLPGRQKDTHGSAMWSKANQIREAGHLGSSVSGFALGHVLDAPQNNRFRYTGHVLTVAPTGAGKGIGAVIPNLLEYPGSALVVDIKGENYAVTARARRAMGHEVFLIDPFNVTGETGHALNWMDMLNPDDPNVVGEASALSEMLFIVNKNDEGNFWDDTAKGLLGGLMVHVAGLDDDERSICTVRDMITGSPESLDETIAIMANSKTGFGLVAKAANAYLSLHDKVRSDVLAALRRHTQFLDDPRIAEALRRSDFRLADIKAKPMTVYIVLPPNMIKAQSRFVRAFIGQTLSVLTTGTKKPEHNVGLFIDEFGQLGYMAAIEDAISLVRGYGVAFWLFIQDLSQLKGVYPKWQTFLANSAKQFFGTADLDTAKYISESLGQYTATYRTANQSSHMIKIHEGSGGSSEQVVARSLLTPDEVMRLGDRPIVLIRGENPHLLGKINYLTDPEYEGLFDPNPYHQ